MDLGLKRRVISGVVRFADDHNLFYALNENPTELGKRESVLEIVLKDYRSGYRSVIVLEDLKPIINHLVYFNSEGSMVGERTSYVENHTSSRRLYVDFLKQMEKKRVHLTNDFEQLWRSEPTRYPMGDDFKY